MLNGSQLYCGWTAGVCWKIIMLNEFVDKNPTIIRRISNEPSQERKYKKENKNEKY